MRNEMLHVFRNDPVGREVYLQGLYFSKMAGLGVRVFLPQHRQFLMYFRDGVVTVELERSFVKYRDTAREHAAELAEQHGVEVGFLEPEHHTASTLPDLPVDFSAMCCPRSIGEPVGKLGVSDIGPMVRSIVRSASFPVFIPAPAHKEFQRIVVFFGGSRNATAALRVGYGLQRTSGLPLSVFTYVTDKSREHYLEVMRQDDLHGPVESGEVEWLFMEGQDLKEALYAVSHDALLVLGAYGHGVVKEMLFGSLVERVQMTLPNNLLVVGPRCGTLAA